MKNILNRTSTALAAVAMILTVSCSKVNPADETEVFLDVNASNLHGNWQLETINGAAVEEGTYFYINFNRSERTFTSYDNLASMYGRERSGSFSIEQDEYGRYILNGSYDYGSGDWATAYEVTMAASGEQMTWRSLATDELVHYVRTEAMPERE